MNNIFIIFTYIFLHINRDEIKQLCPKSCPKFKEITIEFSKNGESMNMIISKSTKPMKESTIEHNIELLSLVGLETHSIPIGKYVFHEEVYKNEFNINEYHHYGILEKEEIELSESDIENKNDLNVKALIKNRIDGDEKTKLGEFYFFTIPNLDNKYLVQRNLTDFFKYDDEFNSYDSDLNRIKCDMNEKVDWIWSKINDFMNDDYTPARKSGIKYSIDLVIIITIISLLL